MKQALPPVPQKRIKINTPHLSYGVPHTKFGLIFEVSFLGLIVEAGKRKAKISGFEGG